MRSLILAADGFEDSELLYPMYRLREEGIAVDVAAAKRGLLTGKHGYTAEANVTFAEVNPADYDVLILPGGKAPESVRLHAEALAIVRAMTAADNVVAAICHGPQVLISAGVLAGRKVTCYEGIRDDVRAAGADYVDAEVAVNGRLITSRRPGDLPAFCFQIMQAIRT